MRYVTGRILSKPRKQAAETPAAPAPVDQAVLDRLEAIEARLAEAATADGVARALKYYDDEVMRPRLSSIKAGLPRRRKA